MKVILTHEVSGLGAAGEVADVKAGYARNYLFRRGLAVQWTKGGQAQVDAILRGRASRAQKSHEDAVATKAKLEAAAVTITAHAAKEGRLFGAVTPTEIAQAIANNGGPSIDRRTIEISAPIKNVGSHKATVRLHDDVVADLRLEVVAG